MWASEYNETADGLGLIGPMPSSSQEPIDDNARDVYKMTAADSAAATWRHSL
jgi:hypothetical protein